MNESKPIGRRGFLGLATWAIGGLISFLMGLPAVAYILGPALIKEEKDGWIRVGTINKVELGTPTLFSVKQMHQTGWITDEQKHSLYILTEDGRKYIAMSNICTHLGCRSRWIAQREQFYCPCHDGVFDKNGNVVSGPPPRPLDRYEMKIEGDQIYIGQLYEVKN
jgi:Rieske Fe-S protein